MVFPGNDFICSVDGDDAFYTFKSNFLPETGMHSFDFSPRTDGNEKEMKSLRVECTILLLLPLFAPEGKRWGGPSRASTGSPGKGARGRGKEPQSPRSQRSVLHFMPPTGITRFKCRAECQF